MKVKIMRLEKEEAKISYQEAGGIVIITIRRPQRRNALSQEMWQELKLLAEKSLLNKKNRVVILRGSGKEFTSGSDIKEFHEMSLEEAENAFVTMENTISFIENLPLPTIGVINGPAMGAGLELALACDLRIGSEHAKMGIPVGNLGITLNNKFTHRLVTLLGPSVTKELVYTGKIFTAEEAFEKGLLNLLVSSEKLNREAIELAKIISQQSPASLRAIKKSVAESINSVPELWKYSSTFVDPIDFPEGVAAFVEKRKPNFKNR
jgi:enoyl-CoA hydratase